MILVMPKGKELFQLTIIGLGIIALVSGAIIPCVLHDKDVFLNTVLLTAIVGFLSYMGDVWT